MSGETIQQLLKRLKINNWNLVLVGDGSGSKWGEEIGMGWACIALEHGSMERKLFHGAANNGTIGMAELLAYLAPLSWYASRLSSRSPYVHHIHIITDSQYAQTVGNAGGEARKKNGVLWTAFQIFNRMGMQLHWHWLPRNDPALNTLADALSKAARTCYRDANISSVSTGELDAQHLNPWE